MSNKPVERILFLPDAHRPYHCKRSWRLMMEAARVFKPDTIVILGDYLDCYQLSSHRKMKPRPVDFFDEVADGIQGLDELSDLGAQTKIYIEGNHEHRLTRYIADNAQALWGAVTLPEVLDLKARGWKWVPYGTSIKLGRLHITHDVGHAGQNALAPTQAAFAGQSVVIGHTHRMNVVTTGDVGGNVYSAAMFGWLADKQAAQEYSHAAKTARFFVNGIGLGYKTTDGQVHLVPVPFVRGRCIIEGQVVAA